MRRRFVLALGLLLAAAWPSAGRAAEVAWQVVDNCGAYFTIQYNTHATAGGWLTWYHGLARPGESQKTVIHAAWVYMQSCDCGETDTHWDVAGGMLRLFGARGYPHTPVKERCRYSQRLGETAGFGDYVARIKQNLPVILTFCYDPAAQSGLQAARPRGKSCISVVGIGYMYYNGRGVLICHDGLSASDPNPAQGDKISPAAWGLDLADRPWMQPGTALYRWDGDYRNLLMVFVGQPTQ